MHEEPLPAGLRTLQLIIIALVLGVGVFGAIVAVAPLPPGPATTAPLVIVTIAVTIVCLALAPLVRHLLLRGARPAFDERRQRSEPNQPAPTIEQRFARFQTATIAACALLEGAALLAVSAGLMTRQPAALVLAAAPLLVMLLAFFPTEARWRRSSAVVQERAQWPPRG